MVPEPEYRRRLIVGIFLFSVCSDNARSHYLSPILQQNGMTEWHDMYLHVRIRDAATRSYRRNSGVIVRLLKFGRESARNRPENFFCSGRSGNESNSRKLIIISQLTISFVSTWLGDMTIWECRPLTSSFFSVISSHLCSHICPKNYLNRHKIQLLYCFLCPHVACVTFVLFRISHQPHVHMFRVCQLGNRQRQLKNYLRNLLIIF